MPWERGGLAYTQSCFPLPFWDGLPVSCPLLPGALGSIQPPQCVPILLLLLPPPEWVTWSRLLGWRGVYFTITLCPWQGPAHNCMRVAFRHTSCDMWHKARMQSPSAPPGSAMAHPAVMYCSRDLVLILFLFFKYSLYYNFSIAI